MEVLEGLEELNSMQEHRALVWCVGGINASYNASGLNERGPQQSQHLDTLSPAGGIVCLVLGGAALLEVCHMSLE